MKKIKQYKISLMEKEGPSEEKDKLSYMIKCSASLEDVEEVFKTTDMEYEDFVLESANIIFSELYEKNTSNVDSVGVWFQFEDGELIDNSIDISVLNDIKKYGSEDIEPIKEFIKMTLHII